MPSLVTKLRLNYQKRLVKTKIIIEEKVNLGRYCNCSIALGIKTVFIILIMHSKML